MKISGKFISIASALLTLLFIFLIAFDIFPLLRGPAPYPPEWQWDYAPVIQGIEKFLLPIIIGGFIIFLLNIYEKGKYKISSHKLLAMLILLGIVFQLSVIFASRGGIFVLVHRVINPGLNGYFTTAVEIENLSVFMKDYEKNVLSLHQHAQGHPPGGILFFYGLNQAANLLPQQKLLEEMSPSHSDMSEVWNGLSNSEKIGSVASIPIISFLSVLTIIPLFYAARIYFDEKIAARISFLYILIPSVILFLPINDVFLPLFSATSALFFFLGIKNKKRWDFFLSGLVFSIGLFFSLSLLPLLLFFFLIFVFHFKEKILSPEYFNLGTTFVLSILILPALLMLLGLNFATLTLTLMQGLPEYRNYLTWLLYNPYDFLIFSGIPVTVLFIYSIFTKNYKSKVVLASFLTMLVVLVLSGAVRGEVGRIWIPFVPFLLFAIAGLIMRLSTRQYQLILTMQAVQVIIMQASWAVLW